MLRKLVLVCPDEIFNHAVKAAQKAKVWLDEYGHIDSGYRKVLDYCGPSANFLIVPYDDREFDSDGILFAIQWELKDLAPGKIGLLKVHLNWVYMPDCLDEELVTPLWEECERYREFETKLRNVPQVSESQVEELAMLRLPLEQKIDILMGITQEQITGLIMDLSARVGGYVPKVFGDNPLMGTAALEALVDLVKKNKTSEN